MPEPISEQRKLAAIMFTDMVGYSALTHRNEKLALELLEEHRRVLREFFPRFNGHEIETTGDGFLVEFASAVEAARCAFEIQRALAMRNVSTSPDRQIQVRIGIHVGDVVHKDGHVLGDGVNIAARLQPLAEPGGICITRAVWEQIHNKTPQQWVKLAVTDLKNISQPMDIYHVLVDQTIPTQASSAKKPSGRRPPQSRRKALWMAAAAVVAGFGAWLWFGQLRGPGAATRIESIAVLPLKNYSGDPAQDYFANGMTDLLISHLGNIKALKVRSLTSVMTYLNSTKPTPQIARELKVDAVLEGSVVRSANRVRIIAQLIHAASDTQLWQHTYEKEMTDVLGLQSEVALDIARGIEIHLSLAETAHFARSRPVKPAALDAYLQGKAAYNKLDEAGLTNAIALFQQSIQLEPTALAYAGLSDSYRMLSSIYLTPLAAMPRAKEAAAKAIALDPNLAEAHGALGMVLLNFDWDWEQTRISLEKALELNPSLAEAHANYGFYLTALGRHEEGIARLKRALDLDPFSLPTSASVELAYIMSGQWERSIQASRHTLSMDTNFATSIVQLGLALVMNGQTHDALAEMAKLEASGQVRPEETTLVPALLANVYALAGEKQKAEAWLVKLQTSPRYICSYEIATAYLALGDQKKAVQWIDRSRLERADCMIWLKVDPRLKPLRQDPEFIRIYRAVGFKD